MIKEVVKRGGRKEPFNLNKIKKSIITAVEKASIPQEEKNKIVGEIIRKVLEFLKNKKEVFTAEIEAVILLELGKLAPAVVSIWREYRYQKNIRKGK